MQKQAKQNPRESNDQYFFFDNENLCRLIDEIFKSNNNKKLQREILELRISQLRGKDIVLAPDRVWTRHGFYLLNVEYYNGITYKLDFQGYIHPRIPRQLDILF